MCFLYPGKNTKMHQFPSKESDLKQPSYDQYLRSISVLLIFQVLTRPTSHGQYFHNTLWALSQ